MGEAAAPPSVMRFGSEVYRFADATSHSAANSPERKKNIKCKFTQEEDEKLKELVKVHGTSSWKLISSLMGTRNHRQCRERYKNYLDPSLRNEPWTLEEDRILVEKYADYGPKWNKIAKYFINRSDNSIRNRWQLILRQWERQKNEEKERYEIYQPPDVFNNVVFNNL